MVPLYHWIICKKLGMKVFDRRQSILELQVSKVNPIPLLFGDFRVCLRLSGLLIRLSPSPVSPDVGAVDSEKGIY